MFISECLGIFTSALMFKVNQPMVFSPTPPHLPLPATFAPLPSSPGGGLDNLFNVALSREAPFQRTFFHQAWCILRIKQQE